MAVERIHRGMACSLSGWINRFKVMAQVSSMARVEKPWRWRMASSPNRFQNWKPTWRGPAERGLVMARESVWTETRSAWTGWGGGTGQRRGGAGLAVLDPADDLLDFRIRI